MMTVKTQAQPKLWVTILEVISIIGWISTPTVIALILANIYDIRLTEYIAGETVMTTEGFVLGIILTLGWLGLTVAIVLLFWKGQAYVEKKKHEHN